MNFRTFVACAALATLSSLAFAQGDSHTGHAGHDAAPADTPATRAYRDAQSKMHRDMDIRYTNDPDVDFVLGMIPHHQGAIEMAKVVLEHGKDEQSRKWARDVIREQEREIAEMRGWLRKRGL